MPTKILVSYESGMLKPFFYVRNAMGAKCGPFPTFAKAEIAKNAIDSGTRDICEGCQQLTEKPLKETPDAVFLCPGCREP